MEFSRRFMISAFLLASCTLAMARPAYARELSLSINKQSFNLGESVVFRISADLPSPAGYYIDLYVYDSVNHLEGQISVKDSRIVFPYDFPITLTYVPLKADVYSAKLWMFQPALSRQAYLEDTIIFTVLPYVATTQTATTATSTMTSVTATKTMETTVTITTRTTITTTDIEITRIGWTNLNIMIIIALLILVAFMIGRRLTLVRPPTSEKSESQPPA
ncbi:MAG: hypothetical protein V1857_00830 [archaeon]